MKKIDIKQTMMFNARKKHYAVNDTHPVTRNSQHVIFMMEFFERVINANPLEPDINFQDNSVKLKHMVVILTAEEPRNANIFNWAGIC